MIIVKLIPLGWMKGRFLFCLSNVEPNAKIISSLLDTEEGANFFKDSGISLVPISNGKDNAKKKSSLKYKKAFKKKQ